MSCNKLLRSTTQTQSRQAKHFLNSSLHTNSQFSQNFQHHECIIIYIMVYINHYTIAYKSKKKKKKTCQTVLGGILDIWLFSMRAHYNECKTISCSTAVWWFPVTTECFPSVSPVRFWNSGFCFCFRVKARSSAGVHRCSKRCRHEQQNNSAASVNMLSVVSTNYNGK